MANARSEVLDWAEQERIAPENLRAALEATGALPDALRWRLFLDRLLLWMGVVSAAAGVIFFFAYNWAEMGRLAKIGLVQLPLIAALGAAWRLGLDSVAGKAAIFAAALLVGALLALIGQTYQTGADPWELFAVWSVAILPWALLARLPVLWLLCIALANLALALYFQTFGRMLGMLFAPERLLWLLFALDTFALVVWEGLAHAGVAWLRERWSVRLLAVASGTMATLLAMTQIFERSAASQWGLVAWLAWIVAAYFAYRRAVRDVFVLAGGVLSAIVVVTSLVGNLIKFGDAGAFLFLGLLVIGMSAAGGWWLKQVANEQDGRDA